MRDDALAPVVAMMLILAVVVTLFSLWNSVYLPGLKQQAEVEHLSQVEEAMERMDSVISDALYYQRNGSLSVPLPLGGGDIMFNNVRSGGVLHVREETMMILTVIDSSSTSNTFPVTISNVTYTPVSNFWVPQGYSWQYGSLNVTKGTLTTPLRICTYDEMETEQFSDALLTPPEKTGDLEITYADIRPGTRNTTSGNGIASLNLNAVRTEVSTIPEVSEITIEIAQDLPYTFKEKLRESVNKTVGKLPDSTYWPEENITYKWVGGSYPDLTINRLELILSVE